MTVGGGQLSNPDELLPFTEDGFPVPGRHRCTLDQVKAGFVDAAVFAGSSSRGNLWRGLASYLELWRRLEDKLLEVRESSHLTKTAWFGGSFISVRPNPANLDVTLFVDGDMLDRGREKKLGVNRPLEQLINRSKIESSLGVTPIVVPYRYVDSPLKHVDLYSPAERTYLLRRGVLDDWWGRQRPIGEPKGPPTRETSDWTRGYVEVML